MATLQEELLAALDVWGLGSLAGLVTDSIIAGDDQLTIINKLRTSAEYKARFPAMDSLIAKAKANGVATVNEGDYLSMERSYQRALQTSGLPSNMWDSPDDYKRLIEADVSPDEVERRVAAAKMAVDSTDPNTRAQLMSMYNLSTTDLMAYALDPQKGSDYIKKVATASTLAGYGQTAGLTGANWESYAQDLINQQASESDLRQTISEARILAEGQTRLAGIEGEQFTTSDAMDIAVRKDANKMLASQRRVEKEKARFSGTQGVSTGSLRGSGI